MKRSKLILFCCYNLAWFVALELSLRALAYYGLVTIKHYATTSSNERLLDDIHPSFGVWRQPNRNKTFATSCFQIAHNSNSYGARDKERSVLTDADNRVLVLGDSFVEGYGVEEWQRMTTIAEAQSGIEFMNFGVSGDFGSIQQWLLYRDLASSFEHSHVAIFFLPDNDFKDNDPSTFPPNRYRPYLKKVGDAKFEVYYPVAFENRSQTFELPRGKKLRRQLYNTIYILNVARQFGEALRESPMKESYKELAHRAKGSAYTKYSEEDLERLLFTYSQIVNAAADRPVTIYVIPREEDFTNLGDTLLSELPLITQLREFASHFQNVRIVDLLPLFRNELQRNDLQADDLFLPCDGHWSHLGHQMGANILARDSLDVICKSAHGKNTHCVS